MEEKMQNLERKFIQKLQKYMTCTSHGKQKYLIFLFPNVLKEILLSQMCTFSFLI